MRLIRWTGILILCWAGMGQTPAPNPLFEVASLKPGDPAGRIGIRRLPGGRFLTSNTSLRLLITWAWDIGEERLTGAPGWLGDARYDVVAKSPMENPTSEQLHAMVQALLMERFRLRVHRTIKELPLYRLEPDNAGVKVHALGADVAISQDPFQMTMRAGLRERMSPRPCSRKY